MSNEQKVQNLHVSQHSSNEILSDVLSMEYPLIPMSEIDEEAREIAVIWGGESGMDWIGDKHKLASDIMNYARRYLKKENRLQLPIEIDGKRGMITSLYTINTGITIVNVDFDKPNPHWKAYTLECILKSEYNRGILKQCNVSGSLPQETKAEIIDVLEKLIQNSHNIDADGEPTTPILDMVDTWSKARDLLSRLRQWQQAPCSTQLPPNVELKDIKAIRNYFGEHDVTVFEHGAFDIINRLINHFEAIKKYEEMGYKLVPINESEDNEAVEFHEWVGKQGYKLSHYAAKGEAVHLHESKGSTPFHELREGDWRTTKELYQIFKSQS